MAKGPKKPCDVCGKLITVDYMPQHKRSQHGIRGGHSGTIRRTPAEMAGPLSPQAVEVDKAAMSQMREHKLVTQTVEHLPTAPTAVHTAPKVSTNGARKIEVLSEFEVVTDGERIGIVEWLR